MPSNHLRNALFVAGLVLTAGCGSCGDDRTKACQSGDCCRSDADCAGKPEPSYCELASGNCRPVDRQCDPTMGPSQCCPGQICSSMLQLCVDKYVSCEPGEAGKCPAKGEVCKDVGSNPRGPGCTWDECGADGSCAEGLFCFNGSCVGEPPCGGGCVAGSVCVTAANSCFPLGDDSNYPPSCHPQVPCARGTILVFRDPRNVFNRCTKTAAALECECRALPPIHANDMVRHSSLAAAGSNLLLSSYDADHGDLVLHSIDKESLRITKTEWIDGVPASGSVEGDPEGPRDGITDAGPDVGLYTSIAYDPAGTTHISYYAARDGNNLLGDLKYAVRTGSGDWKIHTVDGTSTAGEAGDAGLYTHIALSPDGMPVIAYFVRGGGPDGLRTAVKVARATRKEPSAATDWKFATLDTGSRSPVPCSNPTCGADQVCIEASQPGGQCATKAVSGGCSPACGSDEACVIVNNAAVCKNSLRAATLAGLPEGNGLHPAIAYMDRTPVVVWYDHAKKVLKGAIARADSAQNGADFRQADAKVLDDGRPAGGSGTAHDVGMFPSLAVGPSNVDRRIAVAYMDLAARQLRVLTARSDFSQAVRAVADDGKGDPAKDPVLFVGADTAIAFDAQNAVSVLYQDSTGNNLRFARQATGASAFTTKVLADEGAGGFYANLALDGSTVFASHVIIRAASSSESANRLQVMKVVAP